jgi:hypothetical protein
MNPNQLIHFQMAIVKKCLDIKKNLEKKYIEKERKLNEKGFFGAAENKVRARSQYYVELKRSFFFFFLFVFFFNS